MLALLQVLKHKTAETYPVSAGCNSGVSHFEFRVYNYVQK
jgi:hypothetical protein